jgi:ubiquinone/menaquinone biosynthesis C-methylase UbiE
MKHKENRQHSFPEETERYYEMGLEAGRLSGAGGELEFIRTIEIIGRYLPKPPAVVLDVGGGPGAYACWLAKEGYEVHLIDPIALHLEQARLASQNQPGSPVRSITQGDARSLNFPDDTADVVLLLGPLYHLTERADRITALKEALRVLKRGGLLVAVGISRYASTFAGLVEGYFTDPKFVRIAKRDIMEGQHRNPAGKPEYFTTAFFHHPLELQEEVREAGFFIQIALAIEGAAIFLQDLDEQWKDTVRRERILDAVRWLEDEPSVIGVTGHIMLVAIKRRRAG